MAVKVIKNRVFDGKKTYEIGDVIEGLSENDESQLIQGGIVEYVNKKENFILPGEPINQLNGDTESLSSTEIHVEGEKNPSDLIDPNSLALNPDDYVKESSSKDKKEKAV